MEVVSADDGRHGGKSNEAIRIKVDDEDFYGILLESASKIYALV